MKRRTFLKAELVKINPEIFSSIYTIPSEVPELKKS